MDSQSGPQTPGGIRRKQDFQAALRMMEESQSAWARRHGTSKSNLTQVLNEQRVSKRLVTKVDAYIQRVRTCIQQHCQAAA